MNLHAFLDGFVGFEGVRRHLTSRAPIDDQRFGSEPPGGAGGVHRCVAPAVDGDASTESRWLAAALHVLEEVERVVDLPGVSRGDLLPLAQVRANRQEYGVESPAVFSATRSVTL